MYRLDKDEVGIQLKVFFRLFLMRIFDFLASIVLCVTWGIFFFVCCCCCRVRRMAPLRRLRRHLCITARMERAEVLFTVVDRPVWLATVLLDHLILTTIIIQQRLRWLTVTTCRRRPRLLIPPKVSTYTQNFFFSFWAHSDAAMMIENPTGKRCHVVCDEHCRLHNVR